MLRVFLSYAFLLLFVPFCMAQDTRIEIKLNRIEMNLLSLDCLDLSRLLNYKFLKIVISIV